MAVIIVRFSSIYQHAVDNGSHEVQVSLCLQNAEKKLVWLSHKTIECIHENMMILLGFFWWLNTVPISC